MLTKRVGSYGTVLKNGRTSSSFQQAPNKTAPFRLNKELLIKPGDLPLALQSDTLAQIIQAIQIATKNAHAKGIRSLSSGGIVLTLDSLEAKKAYKAYDSWV